MQTLNLCKLKEASVIHSIKDCEMKRRLLDLGFVNGAIVTPVLDSPSKGMRAYLVKGCKIALRNSVSKQIVVIKEDDYVV